MTQVRTIVDSVTRTLADIPDEAARLGVDTNGAWTLLIKDHLAHLGDTMHYQVATSGKPPSSQGRPSVPVAPHDMTWLPPTTPGRVGARAPEAPRVPMVLESGWHSARDDEISADFQLLLAERADLHVLVFQRPRAAMVQHVMDRLEEDARASSGGHSGELYLLCGYDWQDTRQFAFRLVAI